MITDYVTSIMDNHEENAKEAQTSSDESDIKVPKKSLCVLSESSESD